LSPPALGLAELCSKGGCSDHFKSVLAAAPQVTATRWHRITWAGCI
jgi:hypothetical protein